MVKYNLTEDVTTLTLIKPFILNKLVTISESCICDYIDNMIINGEDVIEIDIGIGSVYIKLIGDEIEYKFIPSKKLEKSIVKTILEGENTLTSEIEAKLNTKILNTYKELL